jgi:hypothetical protein
MLGSDIHAHKGQPGNKYSAVEGDPIKLKQGFICQQIHTYHADRKKRYGGGGYGSQ